MRDAFVILDVDRGSRNSHCDGNRGKQVNGSDFMSAMPERDAARRIRVP
jgi:hypothetical protein